MSDVSAPHSVYDLPSQGIVYPLENPLSAGEIELRDMATRDEDIITNESLIKTGKVFNRLIQGCILGKVKVEDMLIGDRNFCLLKIIISGYGEIYNTQVICPDCNKPGPAAINLETLTIKMLDQQPLTTNTNEFEFVLPKSKKRVTFKLMTVQDEQDIQRTAQRSESAGITVGGVTASLMKCILSIDGDSDTKNIRNFIDGSMSAMDSHALRLYIAGMQPDVKLTTTYICPSCGAESGEARFILDYNFFWPTK